MSLVFELGTNSATAIQLYPEYDHSISRHLIESRHRALSGRLYDYTWGYYLRIEFSLRYVPIANASQINQWYNNRTELLYFESSDGSTWVSSVMIMNDKTPLNVYDRPYITYRKGKLILETY